METNGFRDAIAEPITSGIVTIYTATKECVEDSGADNQNFLCRSPSTR